tara:strand:+ start:170 stop:418 length:249 start_codon:yes stop_codon:yes gene_type:complete
MRELVNDMLFNGRVEALDIWWLALGALVALTCTVAPIGMMAESLGYQALSDALISFGRYVLVPGAALLFPGLLLAAMIDANR